MKTEQFCGFFTHENTTTTRSSFYYWFHWPIIDSYTNKTIAGSLWNSTKKQFQRIFPERSFPLVSFIRSQLTLPYNVMLILSTIHLPSRLFPLLTLSNLKRKLVQRLWGNFLVEALPSFLQGGKGGQRPAVVWFQNGTACSIALPFLFLFFLTAQEHSGTVGDRRGKGNWGFKRLHRFAGQVKKWGEELIQRKCMGVSPLKDTTENC